MGSSSSWRAEVSAPCVNCGTKKVHLNHSRYPRVCAEYVPSVVAKQRKPMSKGAARAWNNTVRPRSEKTKSKYVIRREMVAAYLKRFPLCETGCGRPSEDVHEPWTRARGGPITDYRNFMAVARYCHGEIHGNNDASEALGWLVPAAYGRAWLEAGGRDQERKPVAA
jgi:hypothetical protein